MAPAQSLLLSDATNWPEIIKCHGTQTFLDPSQLCPSGSEDQSTARSGHISDLSLVRKWPGLDGDRLANQGRRLRHHRSQGFDSGHVPVLLTLSPKQRLAEGREARRRRRLLPWQAPQLHGSRWTGTCVTKFFNPKKSLN